MTYSALPKAQEPPVNSAAYFEMLEQQGFAVPSSISQSPATPAHFQGPPPGFGALRDRFKATSISDDTSSSQDPRRSQQSNAAGSGLSSLRDQYMNRAKQSTETREESFSQRVQNVSRTIAGEQPPSQSQQQPQQSSAPVQTPSHEESQVQSQSVDDQAVSSEGAVAEGTSSEGASSLENDTTLNATADTPAPSSN